MSELNDNQISCFLEDTATKAARLMLQVLHEDKIIAEETLQYYMTGLGSFVRPKD